MKKRFKHPFFFLPCFSPSRGVSLIEILLVIMLIGILSGVGKRAVTSFDGAKRFRNTIRTMETMRRKLWGDVSLLQNGRRCDFGYCSINGTALADTDLTALQSDGWWISPEPERSTLDAWGNAYTVTDGASDTTIVSTGGDGASGGTGFDTDLEMVVDDDAVEVRGDHIRVYVVDRQGARLTNTHVSAVSISKSTGVVTSLSYDAGGWWESVSTTQFSCGVGVMEIDVAASYQARLLGNATFDTMESPLVVYPKDLFSPNGYNVFEVRLPGGLND